MQRTKTRPIILLVEDFADSRQMLALLLESMDYCVLTAGTGREAVRAAANNDIDLVLTDFNLPDIIGPALVRYVRQLGNHSGHIPAIMLTALDGDEHRELAAQAGCEAFLTKPADFDLLIATIDRLLQLNLRSEVYTAVKQTHQTNSSRGSRNVKVDPCPTSL